MDKVKKYVDRFFQDTKKNENYDMRGGVFFAFVEEFLSADANKIFYGVKTIFDYGYAKGYRACQSEQKKGR